MPIRTLIVVVLALAALSGCGRRGDLEAPGAAPVASTAPASAISPLDPGSTGATRPEDIKQETAPERRFLLDFLL